MKRGKQTEDTEDRLLRRAQVALMLGLNTNTVIKMEKSGELPKAINIRKRAPRHRLSAIRAYIEARA